MDSNSICHSDIDPAIILELSSIVKNNMDNMRELSKHVQEITNAIDPTNKIIVSIISMMMAAIHDTNSVIDTIISIMIDTQSREPTSNMSHSKE